MLAQGTILRRREALWEAAEHKCHWCGCLTIFTPKIVPNQATIDHVVPRGKGGSDLKENMVCACLNCNRRRNKEDILGLPEGSLLEKKEKVGKYPVVSGVVKTTIVPTRQEEISSMRYQRDNALVELVKVRKALDAQRARCEEVENMSLWSFMLHRLHMWFQKNAPVV